jgi:prepilin signal peptidase PulO-like enzyme (type II secretory pathway)
VFKVLYGKDGVGGGDAKLLAGIGALAGAFAVPGVMLGAVATFAFYAVAMGRFDKGAQYPFGPFIVLGYVMWIMFGPYYIY